ncbi:MAG TPA: STAS domain-containing protein [Pseudonocardia sp.]|jgi:anti-anti-sigma factor|nr:STAS domain-containing protein [Pseudonocardia sp.]
MERDHPEVADDEGLLRITPVDAGGAVVVTAAGEVDLATGPKLRAALSDLLEGPAPVPVVVDLTTVDFLGSTGIAVLVDAHWQAVQLHVPLKIVVVADGPVHRTLRTTGVDHHLALYHNVGAALRDIGAR